jgi:phage-related protein
MERLIYTNALGQQIIFSNSGTYRWTQVSGLGENAAAFQVTASPYQDGVTPMGAAYFNSRAVKVDLVIVSDDMATAIRDLNRILNPKLGTATLTHEKDGVSKVLNKVNTRVLPTLPGGTSRGIGFQLSSVIFEAFDPLYSDADYTDAEVSTGANVLSFPLDIGSAFVFDYLNTAGVTVTNSGDVECPVTVIFDGPKTAPITVENLTTGEKIVLALSLLADERLTITTGIDNTNVVKTDLNTGAETVAFQYIDVAQTTFFYLAQGTNTLKITAGEAQVEEATVRFKNRYVGV